MNILDDKGIIAFNRIMEVEFPKGTFNSDDDYFFFHNTNPAIYNDLYDYDDIITFCFGRLHFEIVNWIDMSRNRVHNGTLNINKAMERQLYNFQKGIKKIQQFFDKRFYNLIVHNEIEKLFNELTPETLKKNNLQFDPNQYFPENVKDEPIFVIKNKNDFKAIRYLIFGASENKPDIVAKNLLEGDLTVLNDDKVLVYDKEISESVLYSDFNLWWSKNSKKYGWYNPKNDMNEIEYKVQQYYISNYKKDENPVIIPQVYIHYDPKNKKMREMYGSGKVLKFQRMDFLIIYQGKRVIIEIDGKTHTPEHNLKSYSEQCQYDRNMRFLGYEVFRLGGYELTNDFDKTVKEFFEQLADYLKISHN